MISRPQLLLLLCSLAFAGACDFDSGVEFSRHAQGGFVASLVDGRFWSGTGWLQPWSAVRDTATDDHHRKLTAELSAHIEELLAEPTVARQTGA